MINIFINIVSVAAVCTCLLYAKSSYFQKRKERGKSLSKQTNIIINAVVVLISIIIVYVLNIIPVGESKMKEGSQARVIKLKQYELDSIKKYERKQQQILDSIRFKRSIDSVNSTRNIIPNREILKQNLISFINTIHKDSGKKEINYFANSKIRYYGMYLTKEEVFKRISKYWKKNSYNVIKYDTSTILYNYDPLRKQYEVMFPFEFITDKQSDTFIFYIRFNKDMKINYIRNFNKQEDQLLFNELLRVWDKKK